MSIRVALHHKTEYHYDRPVALSPQVVRLRPAPHCRTPIRSYSLKIQPSGHFLNWQQDPFANYLARLVVPEKTTSFVVEIDLVADMTVINPFDFFLDEYALTYPFTYAQEVASDLKPYLRVGSPSPSLRAYLDQTVVVPTPTLSFLVELNRKVHGDVSYLIREEPGVQTPEETLQKRSGSCRDSSWLLVHLLRHFGLAARFVSGYLIQLTPDEKPIDGPEGPTADFTDLHAWAEVYLPGAGWVGLDPTSGLLAGEGHIPLACSPEPSSAAPISGASEPAEVRFDFSMSVKRVHETPRVTKPFSAEQWQAIDTLADEVDERLKRGDVRLTMGGEPTFVSLDDRDGEEWHTAALGENKRALALHLFDSLCQAFALQGLQHHGQGKWYPGESLPRWSLDCFWLRGGAPLWRDPQWRGDARLNYGHTDVDALRFTETLCQKLGVSARFVVPAFEDVFYYLWRERNLPVNVDPLESKLEDPEERARLLRVFTQGLKQCVGFALPLRAVGDSHRFTWESGEWFIRAERMYLLPGDSPMGLRLPLDSLPWEPPMARDWVYPPDPMSFPGHGASPEQRRRSPWPTATPVMRQDPFHGHAVNAAAPLDSYTPSTTADGSPLVRTALCVEPRDGRLHVFMPPTNAAEHYFALLHVIEDTAAATRLPVIIEGYKPPFHPDLINFSVSPDPGVIEVNIHPSATWRELSDTTSTLYEAARRCRLSAEKFAIDGRATGTGGGGHVVMGGPSPADSPFLRRPDVLRSFLAFWHNHPGLSYLFTGSFVGPTSQAPRVDEGRNDMVPELELAFRQVQPKAAVPPWLVDRLFRNILVDVSGNTHRAEFCIDKLFAPETADGRRGLVEMRGFEMPPHPRMSLLQNLLIRSLLAAFWEKPYEVPLMRWHTALHDRFMLPHFIWNDFKDVLHFLSGQGMAFDPDWFRPQYHFRFPKYGEIAHDAVHLELSAALEPWPVLGEQAAGGGTARFVDSSLDRVQVKVRGLLDSRHVVACNGYLLPLHPTGVVGEYVAGVRYRSWWPGECLHPTVPTHSPLVFDLVDTWNNRSLGGCTLWSTHPGGRNYETFPVNANEAEARRMARFAAIGHLPGTTQFCAPRLQPEHPMTLDLRSA